MKKDLYLMCFALYSFGVFHRYFIILSGASKSLLGFEGRRRLMLQCCDMLVYWQCIPLMINDIFRISKCSVIFSAYSSQEVKI